MQPGESYRFMAFIAKGRKRNERQAWGPSGPSSCGIGRTVTDRCQTGGHWRMRRGNIEKGKMAEWNGVEERGI
jgi:hypothetical protein